ncbi:dihydrofolate reductase family protein [Actinomadura fulvescens]|uniref:Dihydrofolate reductase family protein n=1 Tax=Actinomadura fulvescens TaxID=46160 RepID=A0ABP6CV84_9ACTN
MKIALTEFVTLDGVSQGPGSPDEDTSGGFARGGWLVPHLDVTFVRRVSGWLGLADGLLLGRRTYEAFARDWPEITDPVQTVAGLKARPGRELQIHGSARLGDALLAAGLIDTFRLVVAPTVLRTGRRLLAGAGVPSGLRLTHHEATPNGLLLLQYETAGEALQAEYKGVTAFV